MIRSLYSAASGMVSQLLKQDIIANNIANAQTAGFKRSRGVSESFTDIMEKQNVRFPDNQRPPYPDSPVNPVMSKAQGSVDYSQGALQTTGKSEDFAISGKGYFTVDTGKGLRFTRAGNFQLDSKRFLCTQSGEKVLGEKGPVKMPDAPWQVDQQGNITSEGRAIDKLKIIGTQPGTQVLQGSIESSNVSMVREMVGMITNLRAYEANQRVITSADQTLGKAVTEVGRVV